MEGTSGFIGTSLDPEGGGWLAMREATVLTVADDESVVLATGHVGDGPTILKNPSSKPQDVGKAASGEHWESHHVSSVDMLLK